MNNTILISIYLMTASVTTWSQTNPADSLKPKLLQTVIVEGLYDGRTELAPVEGVSIFAGKKTDAIDLNPGSANLPQNVGRMIFAKIPGVNIWDMDGGGTQMNIGTRGTDAHRSIEMNMRQNGYNTNSDIFGYPENHYTVPMQGVARIQLVRGSSALQFGPQFGGMMNYIMKEGDSTKAFSLESEQSFGSYNFFNSYNAVGGKKGKINYYAYYDNRHGDGWRPNAAFNYNTLYANVKYTFNKKGSIAFQFSRMGYRQQIAGGLTDAQFKEDPRQSVRSRNFFSPKINIPSIIFKYDLSPRTHLQITSHGLWGERSSVQYINTANIPDTVNTTIKAYNPRQVDRDYYRTFATEVRLLHRYQIGNMKSVLGAGLRYSYSHTRRSQKGKGTTASDFDLSLVGPYGIDIKATTLNYAIFAENIFWATDNLSITPGFRYDVINSDLTGVINNATYPIAYKGHRKFPLFGVGVQYQVSPTTQLYANISQAYRPYLYAYITPADQYGVIDPNMKDSKGYDIDAGYRGQLGFLNFDINAFYLYYGDKIGKLTMPGANNTSYLLTTNIGNSVAKGVELYANLSLMKLLNGEVHTTDVRLFTSVAYTHARFTSGSQLFGTENLSMVGKRVENTPDWIDRSGVEFRYKGLSTTFQVSHSSLQYNDANNTVFSANAVTGSIPSYTICDWAFSLRLFKQYRFSTGINNLANTMYFSRRINMYPGPGILPADGRTFYITLGCKL